MMFLPWLKVAGLSEDVSLDFLYVTFGDASSDWTHAKIWMILWICTNMLFICVSLQRMCND